MDESNTTHNAISSSCASRVTVHYPFHPLCGQRVEVVRAPRREDGAFTVVDPSGRHLKIPAWMVSRAAGEMKLSAQATIHARALVCLAELLDGRVGGPDGEPSGAG